LTTSRPRLSSSSSSDSCCGARRPSKVAGWTASWASRANTPGIRHIAFVVEDIEAVVAGLRAHGGELVGELERYEDIYRLCYVRGPEGIIIELAERIG
jgi:catechol 2,3-dioxygenase-like lactoylglutathione lyase family enzyme